MTPGLKRAFLRFLKRGRIFEEVAVSRWRSKKLLILCYHGISFDDEHEWKPSFSMLAATFEARLAMLKEGGYSVLPLDEGLQRLYSNTLPPKSVAITFDDGLYSFYVKALPIIRRFGFPVTLYLTTYYCFQNLPVFPLICSYMLWKKRGAIFPALRSAGLEDAIDLRSTNSRMAVWNQIQAYSDQQGLRASQKNELAKELAHHLAVDFDTLVAKRLCHLMNPDEIREISRQGVDIQMHTHRHRSPQDPLAFQQEIVDNRLRIEELTGHTPRHHCYPSGVYKPPFLSWLSKQQVASATTCDPGFATAESNPLLLPRFLDAANVSPIEFESWLTGVGAWLPRNPLSPLLLPKQNILQGAR